MPPSFPPRGHRLRATHGPRHARLSGADRAGPAPVGSARLHHLPRHQRGRDGHGGEALGKYLVSRGLAPFDESSLAGSLAAAQGERHDTDGDGISDIDALQRRLDPNGSPSGAPMVEDPSFGCSATGGGAGNTLLFALLVGLRLAVAQVCRWRGLARSPTLPDSSKESEGGGSSEPVPLT